jgi:TolB protein
MSTHPRQPRRRGRRGAFAAALTAAAALVLVGSPASADPHPRPNNGQITFGRFDPAIGWTHLSIADSNGRHERQLTPDIATSSDWSPDGRLIAFGFIDSVGDTHLATIRPDGTGRRQLTNELGVEEIPSWSPDGTHIAYDAGDPNQPDFSTSIWLIRSDGTQARQLTTDGFDVEPSFAPDGRRIAFTRIVEDLPVAAPQTLETVTTDGSQIRQVVPTTDGLEHPQWSPDGHWIAFNIAPEAAAHGGTIYVVHPDGTDLHVLRAPTAHQVYVKPHWSPDGRQILTVCHDDRVGIDQLCTFKVDGHGPVHTLPLDASTFVNVPDWGPKPKSHS